MVDPGSGPEEAALAVAARHALHDEELVAAFSTGSLDDASELMKAQQLVDRCAACRDLHRDLETLGGALRASAQLTTTAPRDFRLSAQDANRLGGPVSARGFLAGLRSALAGFTKPVGASMTALGLVGLLVSSASLGTPASTPMTVDNGIVGATAGSELNPGAAQASSPGATARTAAIEPGASTFEDEGGGPRQSDDAAAPTSRTWLLGGSLGLLAGGVLLLGLAFRRGRQHRTRA